MLDFSQEESQRERRYGPVPAGSIVVVSLQILEPGQGFGVPGSPLVANSRNGLHYLYAEFTVAKGEYEGVHWRQRLMLPVSMQAIQLTANQEKACKIGGSQIKAILQSAGKPTAISDFAVLNGLRFPVKVKINQTAVENNGRIYWNNEIAKVITPEMPEYNEIRQAGELINPDGAIEGNSSAASQAPNQSANYGSEDAEAPRYVDEVPF